jgi:hypothetical protein
VEEQDAAGLSAARGLRDALIAGAYLAGTDTRRVCCTLAALFGGAVGKDVVSRVWRKVQIENAGDSHAFLRVSRPLIVLQ